MPRPYEIIVIHSTVNLKAYRRNIVVMQVAMIMVIMVMMMFRVVTMFVVTIMFMVVMVVWVVAMSIVAISFFLSFVLFYSNFVQVKGIDIKNLV